jgi:hypothetical protein
MLPEGIFNNRKPRDATAAALSWTPLLLAAIVVLIDVFSIMPPASAAAWR